MFFHANTIKRGQKMPNYDVHANHHFFMPNNLKKGQISRIWPQKCQPGNPGDGATHLAVEYDRLELGLYDVLCGVTCAQSYHTALISKICSYLMFYALGNITVLISKKCPCLGLASLFFHIFCGLIFLNKQYLIDMQTISNSL